MDDRGTRIAPATCPRCHATVSPTRILYGYPTDDWFENVVRGDVVLGGCIVTRHDPTHVCPRCGTRLVRLAGGGFDVWVPLGRAGWLPLADDSRPN